jgi:DNA-binding IclR family transcriptional regulator
MAKGVRGIAMGQLDDTARQLLREMGFQAEGNPTLDVLPREAAENLGLDPSSPEYRAALNHLVALGDIERKPDGSLYQLTLQGFKRAKEIRWWR